jgi:hypothetical protein
MPLAERLDVELLEVIKVEVEKNCAVDVVLLEGLHDGSVHASPTHPVDDLIGRP